jgi:6-phosphogluconolactonase
MRKTVLSLCGVIVIAAAGLVATPVEGQDFQPGAVFIMTNAPDANEVIAFSREVNGSLTEQGRFVTGGRGSGGTLDPLHSQDSLILSTDHRFLFAVNAGSGDISVFRVHGAQLELLQTAPCGGSTPIAVAVRANELFVLNAGPNAGVVSFRRLGDGKLVQIAESSKPLSSSAPTPSGLAISPNGQFLAVTEGSTNLIDTFAINSDGTLGSIVSTASSGPGPFSIEFAPNGSLLVTEAPNSSLSSYSLQADGRLAAAERSLPTGGTAACWHAITPNGRIVFTSNSGTSSISSFALGPNGQLTPIGRAVVAVQPTGSTNLDIAITQNGKFLYALNAGAGNIGIFAIQGDGTLVSLGTAGQFPASAGENGIAAF